MDEVERLIEQLNVSLFMDRVNAASKLGKMGRRAVPALIEALEDKDGDVRREAARALGKIGDASAIPALIEAFKDRDWGVRFKSSEALVAIGEPAVPALIEALKDDDSHADMRTTAFGTLGKFVGKCKTVEDFEKVERGIDEGSAALRKVRVDKGTLINLQIKIAKLTREIAEKKDELAPQRDLLLDDKPKAPTKGRGVYQTLRVKNR